MNVNDNNNQRNRKLLNESDDTENDLENNSVKIKMVNNKDQVPESPT